MKYVLSLSFIMTLLSVEALCQDGEKSSIPLFSGPIPADTALVFGQGIISTDNYEFAITFSPEMDELFFTRRKPGEENEIYTMRLQGGKWSEPEAAFFSTARGWDFEPHISPKGDMLYFGSTRPLDDTAAPTGMHQWYSKKNADGWGPPAPLEKPFAERFVMYVTSSANGTLYFTSGEEGARPEDGGIYYSIKEGDKFTDVKRMEKEISLPGTWTAHPYIAPDESYIIYDGKSDTGFGDCDLYISFNRNGTWSEPVNLGPEINTDQCEMCASVSPDGKYLFFHRGVYSGDGGDIGNIFWTDFIRLKKRIENENKNQQLPE